MLKYQQEPDVDLHRGRQVFIFNLVVYFIDKKISNFDTLGMAEAMVRNKKIRQHGKWTRIKV